MGATTLAFEDCTKAVETQATSKERAEAEKENETEKETHASPQPQNALDVATPAGMNAVAAAENLNAEGTEAPAATEASAKCEDWSAPVVVEQEQAVTVTAPVELKGM